MPDPLNASPSALGGRVREVEHKIWDKDHPQDGENHHRDKQRPTNRDPPPECNVTMTSLAIGNFVRLIFTVERWLIYWHEHAKTK
jgi:hypothetical protein